MKGDKIIPVVSVSVIDEKRVLIVQEGKTVTYQKWNFPGGRLEWGESITQAAIREVLEETGLHVKLTGLLGTYNYISPLGQQAIRFHFLGEPVNGEISCDGQEILQVAWKSFHELEQMEDEQLFCPEIFRIIIGDINKQQLHPLQVLQEYVRIDQ